MHLRCSARGERNVGKWGPLTCAHFRFRSQIGFLIGAQQKGSKPLKGELNNRFSEEKEVD